MKKVFSIFLIFALFALSSCSQSSDESSSQSEEIIVEESDKVVRSDEVVESEDSTEKVEPGSYITLAAYESAKDEYRDSDLVLFFNANWCSTCKIARDNIQAALQSIPSDLTIVLVDFDTETDLRKKYGVVIQHTFVQVNAFGKELAKWSGSVTVEAIAEKTV